MRTKKEEYIRLKFFGFEFECINPGKNSKMLLVLLLTFLLVLMTLWLVFKN